MNRIFTALILLALLIPLPSYAARVETNLVVLYDFTATTGTVVEDKTSAIPSLDLTIPDLNKVEWLNPGLRVKEPTLLKTTAARTKLAPDTFFSVGITIEAWIKPLNITQSGPARIVSFSQNSANRNFTLGQQGDAYDQRFRTSVNIGNGNSPSTITPAGAVKTELQHVVYTRDSGGTAKLYIDKIAAVGEFIPGDGTNWDMSYGFGLFNELSFPTDDRTWLGDIFLVAIYDRALSSGEVAQNFDAGVPGAVILPTVTLAWDANTEENLAGYKIYYGSMSRKDSSLDSAQILIDAMDEYCGTGTSETTISCRASWEAYCADMTDKLCDIDLFNYDGVVHLNADVTQYTLSLPYGTYYLAATAYNDQYNPDRPTPNIGKESKYSIELLHTVSSKPGVNKPGEILRLRKIGG